MIGPLEARKKSQEAYGELRRKYLADTEQFIDTELSSDFIEGDDEVYICLSLTEWRDEILESYRKLGWDIAPIAPASDTFRFTVVGEEKSDAGS